MTIKVGQLRVFKFRSLAGQVFVVTRMEDLFEGDAEIYMIGSMDKSEDSSTMIMNRITSRKINFLLTSSDLLQDVDEEI